MCPISRVSPARSLLCFCGWGFTAGERASPSSRQGCCSAAVSAPRCGPTYAFTGESWTSLCCGATACRVLVFFAGPSFAVPSLVYTLNLETGSPTSSLRRARPCRETPRDRKCSQFFVPPWTCDAFFRGAVFAAGSRMTLTLGMPACRTVPDIPKSMFKNHASLKGDVVTVSDGDSIRVSEDGKQSLVGRGVRVCVCCHRWHGRFSLDQP